MSSQWGKEALAGFANIGDDGQLTGHDSSLCWLFWLCVLPISVWELECDIPSKNGLKAEKYLDWWNSLQIFPKVEKNYLLIILHKHFRTTYISH